MQNSIRQHYRNLGRWTAAMSGGIIFVATFTGCSKQKSDQAVMKQAVNAEPQQYSSDVAPTAKNILRKKAADYGLCLGYDSKRARFVALVALRQESAQEPVPAPAQGMVHFLKDLAVFSGCRSAIEKPQKDESSNKIAIALTGTLDLPGFDAFAFTSFLTMDTNEALLNTSRNCSLHEEISFRVDGFPVSYRLAEHTRTWKMSPAAARSIEKHFKAAGGRIVDEASVISKNSVNAGLTGKAWLMEIVFQKPESIFPVKQ
jgi:hypothetical protein